MSKLKPVALGTLCLLTALGVSAEREWPEKEYSCQVVTSTGANGLIGIQTLSRERAEEVVIGHTAITLTKRKEQAVSVVQCIEKSTGEHFDDPSFQSFVENLGG